MDKAIQDKQIMGVYFNKTNNKDVLVLKKITKLVELTGLSFGDIVKAIIASMNTAAISKLEYIKTAIKQNKYIK